MVGIAQLVRASGCGPEGRRFEPDYSPHSPADKRSPDISLPGAVCKKLLKNFEKSLDKRAGMWYTIQAVARAAATPSGQAVEKTFEKSLKNLLTKPWSCGIIIESLR